MNILTLLIVVPILVGCGLLVIKNDGMRRAIATLVTVLLAAGSIWLLFPGSCKPLFSIDIGEHAVNMLILGVEIAMGLYMTWVGLKNKRPLIVLFCLSTTALMVWFEQTMGKNAHVKENLFTVPDDFSIIMALINGIVGGAISLYALGYMKEYHHHHPEVQDRRPLFFGTIFVFTGAMYGIVFANNLAWLLFFWEITTLCSFLLIGYKQDAESKHNALRALTYNSMGGLAFAGAIVWFFHTSHSLELSEMLKNSRAAAAVIPASLLCFAGITKSAQFPFSRWLLGAMVAPTPTSALLHSSTMVKAGVYIMLRVCPVMAGTMEGSIVALVGAVTFMIGSFAAITVSDAKRILAYSTVANLGLIVICAGIGTPSALWAGILLIIFHAVSKCLLFLCVGLIEHKLHSRNIEAMDGLIIALPKVSLMLQIGIAGMFLAPFGMLISKWAVLKAVVDSNPLLTLFIVFGSATTLMFWVKWLGKLLEVSRPVNNIETGISAGEWFALAFLSVLTIAACLFFPLISTHLIDPYVKQALGQFEMPISNGNIVIMVIMLAMICLFPFTFYTHTRHMKVMEAYLSGANLGSSIKFQGSAGAEHNVTMTSYYFADLFTENQVFTYGALAGTCLLVFLMESLAIQMIVICRLAA